MPLWSAPRAVAEPLEERSVQAPECGRLAGHDDGLRAACVELKAALKAGIERVEAKAAKRCPDQDSWEFVESPAPSNLPQNVPWSSQIKFWVNGEEVVITDPLPSMTLLDWLRESRGLTGTHMGCNEGGCGICTVSLTRKEPSTGQLRQRPINSCLRQLCAVDGCHVLTTQGIGCQQTGPHSVQTAIAHGNGSQCGFCTPGWVMGMYSLLEQNGAPSREEVEKAFDGNLCRCTGYRPILSAFGQFAQGGKLCGQHVSVPHPPELLSHADRPLHFTDAASGDEWFRPTTLEELTAAMSMAGGKPLKLLCSSTAINGLTKYYSSLDSGHVATAFVDVSLLPELQGVQFDGDGLRCGAAVCIADVIDALEERSRELPAFGTLATHMRRIASVHIRSIASWAGNVMFTREHPAFPSDMVTILTAAGASFEAKVGTEVRRLSAQNLLSLEGTVLLLSMTIPKAPAGAIFQTFKTAARAAFAHAHVNCGAYIAFQNGSRTVRESRIVLGGTNTKLLRASRTEAALAGHPLDRATLGQALAALRADIAESPSTDERTTAAFREKLASAFLYKIFLGAWARAGALAPRLQSALEPFATAAARPISSGTESFGSNPSESPISQYIPKTDSLIQASGEAQFPSDYGMGGLVGQLVYSTAAKARLLSLDPSEALKMPGVRDFVTASAVPAVNCVNPVTGSRKEKIFFEVNDVVPCVGAVLGMVLADTWREAKAAAERVSQRYATSGPVVRTIEDACQLRHTVPGNSAASFARQRGMRTELAGGVAFKAEGIPTPDGHLGTAAATFKCGGQKHFYMETQSVCVIPQDGNQWEVISSDQDANLTQQCVAKVLGQPAHHVNVKVPRAGGAYGGKLTRHLMGATATAVAAAKHRRPVRLQNERYADSQIVGGREAMHFQYQATFDGKTGKVDTMKLHMVIDGGWDYADSQGSMSMAVGWSDNCYHYRSFNVTTEGAVTDTPMGTFMRAPGCMQSILAAEVAMEHIAKTVGRPLEEVQALNFYRVQDETPFGDHIGQNGYNWTIPVLWSQIQEKAQYADRKASAQAFNEANRWRKRGIAISPAKYVMDTSAAQYDSGALVCIYSDGSVTVSTGCSEIGQGLNTAVELCVSNALGAPLELVKVGPRETSKVPNNTGTGGSGSTECAAAAAMRACEDLCARLAPYRAAGRSWAQVVAAAATDHVSLMASSWFAQQNHGNKNTYATYGAAVSEVEVDALTGEVRVERVDVLMDLGTQLDAAVDIGQVQGGFVIALGYILTEELKVNARGTQLHLGTWDYKVPGAYDIPVEFNVSLLKDSPNPVGVKGSKACAEPSMCLVPSVYLAVKNAIYAARQETGQGDDWFMLDAPLTPERVCVAIGVPQSQFDLPAQ